MLLSKSLSQCAVLGALSLAAWPVLGSEEETLPSPNLRALRKDKGYPVAHGNSGKAPGNSNINSNSGKASASVHGFRTISDVNMVEYDVLAIRDAEEEAQAFGKNQLKRCLGPLRTRGVVERCSIPTRIFPGRTCPNSFTTLTAAF